jgi:hypothetical protein
MEKCIIHVNYSNETILMVILNFDGHHHDFFPARVLGGVTRKIRLNDFALFTGSSAYKIYRSLKKTQDNVPSLPKMRQIREKFC